MDLECSSLRVREPNVFVLVRSLDLDRVRVSSVVALTDAVVVDEFEGLDAKVNEGLRVCLDTLSDKDGVRDQVRETESLNVHEGVLETLSCTVLDILVVEDWVSSTLIEVVSFTLVEALNDSERLKLSEGTFENDLLFVKVRDAAFENVLVLESSNVIVDEPENVGELLCSSVVD